MKQNNINQQLIKESIFIIGSVSSVSGRTVKIKVNKNKNASHLLYNGEVLKNISVNSYVKITKGFTNIIGKVEGEYIETKKVYNEEYSKAEDLIERYLQVSLFGHFEGEKFQQGIKEMPLVDNECYLLDREEFEALHKFNKDGELTINIGVLTEEPAQEIKVSINSLFASHIGVFGNTGSGKSNTLARIYYELFKTMEGNSKFQSNSKFIIIDFNGEYGKYGDEIITTNKKVYNLSDQEGEHIKYPIKTNNIEKLEIISVLLEATEKMQKPFLDRALKNNFLNANFEENARINIKKIVNDIIQKADISLGVQIFEEFFGHIKNLESTKISETILTKLRNNELKFHSNDGGTYYIGNKTPTDTRIFANANPEAVINNIFSELDKICIDTNNFGKIKFKIISQYYHELLQSSNQEFVKHIIGRMFRKFDLLSRILETSEIDINNNLQVINLKNIDSVEMTKTLPLMICKQLYDNHKSDKDFKNKSLHIIIDEAHNILSNNSQRETESWKDYRLETFEEIIKEGRKFNVFLTIASQRPSDISETIISQLHNYFIHKLINEYDIKAIHKTVAYLDKLSFESIPILSTGSCFFAGLATNLPVKVNVNLLDKENRPNSETVTLENIWR